MSSGQSTGPRATSQQNAFGQIETMQAQAWLRFIGALVDGDLIGRKHETQFGVQGVSGAAAGRQD